VQGLLKSGFYQEAVGENFNLASGKEISILEMANLVNETTNNKADLIYKPKRKWDTKPRLLASIEKAQRLINYHPMIEFKDGFMKNIEWFRDNWEIIESVADFPPGMSSAVRDEEKTVVKELQTKRSLLKQAERK
jgi:nucleoside-diphosphate-sugar epimerase